MTLKSAQSRGSGGGAGAGGGAGGESAGAGASPWLWARPVSSGKSSPTLTSAFLLQKGKRGCRGDGHGAHTARASSGSHVRGCSSASGPLALGERQEREAMGGGTRGSSFWGSFLSRTARGKKNEWDPQQDKGLSGPCGFYSSALRPVPETSSRAWPSSPRLGRYSRCHPGHKAVPTREEIFFYSTSKGRRQCWERPPSHASLCLVSPRLSGQLRNELSGLKVGAALDVRGHWKGRMGMN